MALAQIAEPASGFDTFHDFWPSESMFDESNDMDMDDDSEAACVDQSTRKEAGGGSEPPKHAKRNSLRTIQCCPCCETGAESFFCRRCHALACNRIPTFESVSELHNFDCLYVHHDYCDTTTCDILARLVSMAALPRPEAREFLDEAARAWEALPDNDDAPVRYNFASWLLSLLSYEEQVIAATRLGKRFQRTIESHPRVFFTRATAPACRWDSRLARDPHVQHASRVEVAWPHLESTVASLDTVADENGGCLAFIYWLCVSEAFKRLWRCDIDGIPDQLSSKNCLPPPHLSIDPKVYYSTIYDAVRATLFGFLASEPHVNYEEVVSRVVESDIMLELFAYDQEKTLHYLLKPGLSVPTRRLQLFVFAAIFSESHKTLDYLLSSISDPKERHSLISASFDMVSDRTLRHRLHNSYDTMKTKMMQRER